jgi:hypothetical protein
VKAHVSISSLTALFPTIERLGVSKYLVETRTDKPDCVFFEYRHGAFTSDPSDEFCRVFGEPGPTDPTPVPFDETANVDLASLRGEFNRLDVPIQYLFIHLDSDGAVGPGSAFNADRCVGYFYQPGWSTLPEADPDVVSTGIDANWYKTDFCP